MRFLPPERPATRRFSSGAAGFTLLELLVASTIFLVVLALVFAVTNQTSQLWKSTNAKISTFQNARAAFDSLTRNLGQATLNHSFDYYDSTWKRRDPAAASFVPAHYGRWSDLRFLSGPASSVIPSGSTGAPRLTHAVFFQAPIGRVENAARYGESVGLLNAIGYQVVYADPADYEPRPNFLDDPVNPRKRFLLLQTIQPSERLAVYDPAAANNKWIERALDTNQTRVLAENIVALIILPMDQQGDTTLAPLYSYDSYPPGYDDLRSHLLPPMLQVTLVAIDEDSAARLAKIHGSGTPGLVPDSAFTTAANFESDLDDLKKTLNGENGGPRLNYRVFTATLQTKEKR